MKTFIVQIPIAGCLIVEVEAENAEAAENEAWNQFNERGPDVGEVEWEAYEKIADGNVVNTYHNEVEVIEVSEA